MRVKLLLLCLSLCMVVSANASKVVSGQKSAPISEAQFSSMRDIMHQITDAKINAPGSVQELFNTINGATGQYQSNIGSESPVQGAVTGALQKGFHIVCFQEGDDKVLASTDPTLLGKLITEVKTSGGELVRDLAVNNLRASGDKDEAGFTYEQSSNDGVLVDGKTVPGKRFIAYVVGRKVFKSFASDKKFLAMIIAEDKYVN